LAVVPVLGTSGGVVQLPRGFGGVGHVVDCENACANGISYGLGEGVIGRERGSPSVRAEDQLRVTVVVDGTTEGTICENVISEGFALGLAEGSGAAVGVRAGSMRRALSSPVVIPVSVQVNAICSAGIEPSVLAP